MIERVYRWLLVAAVLVTTGASIAAPSGASAGGIVFTLSEALDLARRHGPGFEHVRLQHRSRQLESDLVDAGRRPLLTLSGRTELHPEVGQNVRADVEWSFHDSFTLSAVIDRTWDKASGELTDGLTDNVTLSFQHKLWPGDDADLDDRIRRLEDRITELDGFHELVDAHVAVIDAFHGLERAEREAMMAGASLKLAQARTRLLEAAFAAGEEGLKALQDVRQAERQALVAHRNATTARAQAARYLLRIVGHGSGAEPLHPIGEIVRDGTDEGEPDEAECDDALKSLMRAATDTTVDGRGLAITLVDDFAWSRFVERIGDEMGRHGDSIIAQLSETDVSRLRVELAEMRAAELLHEVRSDRGLQWQANAAYTLPIPDSTAASGGATGGRSGGESGGRFTAFIGSSWQWGGDGGLRVEQAEVAFESARRNTLTARRSAMDAAESALRTLEDAAFAREVAEGGVARAEATLEVVESRVELGFAGPLEHAQARLDVERTRAELFDATALWHKAWLEIARRLEIPLTVLLRGSS